MNIPKIDKIYIILGYLFFIAFTLYDKENLQNVLMNSLPIREMYYPTIMGISYFYILPILIGLVIRIKLPRYDILESLSLSLYYSLIFLLPIFIISLEDIKNNMSLFLSISYLFLLTPILVIVGYMCGSINNNCRFDINKDSEYRLSLNNKIMLLIIISFMIILNLIPVLISKYPVGSDVYYHIGMSNNMMNGRSFLDSPYFYEGKNYYTPLVYIMIDKLSFITNISILDMWRIYPVILSPIFIVVLFFLSSYLAKNYTVGILSILFVFSWGTILWSDPSPRLLSVTLMLLFIFLYLKGMTQRKYLIYSGIIFVAIILSHPEIPIITVMIILIFMMITKYYGNIIKILKFLKYKINIRVKTSPVTVIDSYSLKRYFSIILLLYTSTILYFVIIGRDYYGNNFQIFNEIALSVIRPIGPISFIVFIFAIPSIPCIIKDRSRENTMILSMILIYTSVFFYFTKLWILYHRYIAEVAYIGLSILAAITIVNILKNKTNKTPIMVSIMILFFASIYVNIEWTMYYAHKTDRSIDNNIEILQDIRMLNNDSVILADPNDIINRYIPSISGKYIFSGRWNISKEEQWSVINGLATLSSIRHDATERVELANNFLINPNTLDEIRKNYRVTHLLLKKGVFVSSLLEKRNDIRIISENDGYVLLEII